MSDKRKSRRTDVKVNNASQEQKRRGVDEWGVRRRGGGGRWGGKVEAPCRRRRSCGGEKLESPEEMERKKKSERDISKLNYGKQGSVHAH